MEVMAKDESVKISKLTLGPFDNNSFIITCCATRESVLVDAPSEAGNILKGLEGTDPQYILITHTHMDHLGALSELHSELRIPIAVHSLEAKNLPSAPEVLLGDGDTISFGTVGLKVLHTPGHTPGSICFLTGKYLISGDTIFPGGPGKTHSPAKLQQIIDSITRKIFVLPEDTRIFPGHGASTIVKREKAEFDVFSSRPQNAALCGDVLWLSS